MDETGRGYGCIKKIPKMDIIKLIKDIILTIIMIPFILLGLGLFILFGVIHFTMWWWRRLRANGNK
jgi:ABC-type spermidine/putrescine transport system permease subunit II